MIKYQIKVFMPRAAPIYKPSAQDYNEMVIIAVVHAARNH